MNKIIILILVLFLCSCKNNYPKGCHWVVIEKTEHNLKGYATYKIKLIETDKDHNLGAIYIQMFADSLNKFDLNDTVSFSKVRSK